MRFRAGFGTAVLASLAGGIVVGYFFHRTAPTPEAAKEIADNFSLAANIFLRFIKMIIAPLVFSGLVVGITGMGDAKAVARVGMKSMIWFVSASFISLLIGMITSNLFNFGTDLQSMKALDTKGGGISVATFNAHAFIEHIVPTSFFQAMAQNEVLSIVVFSIFFGLAASSLRDRLPPAVLQSVEGIFEIMLRVTKYVMFFTPVGVFGAVASVITVHGLGVLSTYGKFIIGVYSGILVLWCILLFVGYCVLGRSIFALLRLIANPMLIAFCTSSSEAVYPKLIEQLTRFGVKPRITNFVLPLGYSFNLDGLMMYQAFAIVFIAQAFGVGLSLWQQFVMLLVMLLTSKGIAGVPRASIVVVAATLPLFHLPLEGVVMLLAVDQFIDMSRTATNVLGNSIASSAIAKWENALDKWSGREYSLPGIQDEVPLGLDESANGLVKQ